MSRHVNHRLVSKFLLDDEYDWLHKWMDEPAWAKPWRAGKFHRHFRHDPITTPIELAVRNYLHGEPTDLKLLVACLLHIGQDQLDSFLGITKVLDMLDEIDKEQRKRIKKATRRTRLKH